MLGDAYGSTDVTDDKALPAPDGLPPDDLYEVLQVSPRASLGVIQAAYRVLARNHHPDVATEPRAAEMMRHLNLAYGVLSDPARRAQYDIRRPAERWTRSSPTMPRVRRRPVLSARASNDVGTTSAGMLFARLAAAVVIAASIAFAILIVWTVLKDLDDRPGPTYRLRSGTIETGVGPRTAVQPVYSRETAGGNDRARAPLVDGVASYQIFDASPRPPRH
jgi:hypothetical protein